MYIHKREEWPEFRWAQDSLAVLLADVRHAQGRLLGRMEGLGFELREEATLQTLTQDVVKTSEIEGEKLDVPTGSGDLAKNRTQKAAHHGLFIQSAGLPKIVQ
jgi:Fic family protein